MVKRTASRRYYDERTFGVTVRYVNPPDTRRYEEQHMWLKDYAGADFATYLGGLVNGEECTLLMINDLAVALNYIRHFGLRVAGLPRHLP